MVFIIDLPLLKDTPTAATKDERPTAFFTELSRFLGATGIDDSMIRSLSRYDFSRTAKLGFVYTMYVTSGRDQTVKAAPHVRHPRTSGEAEVAFGWGADKTRTHTDQEATRTSCEERQVSAVYDLSYNAGPRVMVA